jgi:Family of unknown function (DUF6492)
MSLRYTFVPVVFELKLPFLEVQARSFAEHVAPDLVERAVIVDNTRHGISGRRREGVVAAYGVHADNVEIVRGNRVAPAATSLGWMTQQVLKLAVARRVQTERYVTLDAKNFFVAPLDRGYLEAPDGRARVGAHPYDVHPLLPALRRALRYFDLPEDGNVEQFPATVTPYVLYAQDVRDLIDAVEAREGTTFERAFIQQDFTEFFLYAAWLTSRYGDREVRYAQNQPGCQTVWPGRPTLEAVQEAVRNTNEQSLPVFSVHRTALVRMDPAAIDALCDFWATARLFPSAAVAQRFVTTYRDFFGRHVWIKRAREAPARVARRLRRARA